MNAKRGKTSIGCFFVFWLCLFSYTLWVERVSYSIYNHPLIEIITIAFILLPVLGITFGIFGMIKKESPKLYCTIGVLLNFFPNFFLALFVGAGL